MSKTAWGVPVHDDRKHFEFLVLESAQAGLNPLINQPYCTTPTGAVYITNSSIPSTCPNLSDNSCT